MLHNLLMKIQDPWEDEFEPEPIEAQMPLESSFDEKTTAGEAKRQHVMRHCLRVQRENHLSFLNFLSASAHI